MLDSNLPSCVSEPFAKVVEESVLFGLGVVVNSVLATDDVFVKSKLEVVDSWLTKKKYRCKQNINK